MEQQFVTVYFALMTSAFVVKGATIVNETSADICGPNEEFQQCGSACPENCAFPEGAIVCTQQCVSGCFCMAGYRRNHNGTCIEEHLCKESTPDGCGQNEEFLECGSQCSPTCENPTALVNCSQPCTQGCFCKEGYVRDTNSGQCVDQQACSEFCLNEYEEYSSCLFECQPTCLNLQPICNQSCVTGCVCTKGLVRGFDWKCIPPAQCSTNTTFNGDILAPLWRILERLILSTINKN